LTFEASPHTISTMIPKIETSESLTIFFDSMTHTVRRNEARFPEFVKAVESENLAAIRMVLGVGVALPAYTKGQVKVVDGEVTFKG